MAPDAFQCVGVRVSLRDFREIGAKNDPGKAERLFKAAVSAFCCLTRPSRRDLVQLDALTLPLFSMVSVEARRYVAAALSECAVAPPGLLARLADERIDIAAPLLVRSSLLTDVALIGLIGRHGIGHARAVARRPALNPTIAQLIRALESSLPETAMPTPSMSAIPTRQAATSPGPRPTSEDVRERLRAMMRTEAIPAVATALAPEDRLQIFRKLRDSAFTGNETFFHTALADALRMNFSTSRHIFATPGYSPLLAALRSLDLTEEQAFMIAASVKPAQFAHGEAVRMFLGRYRALDRDTALDRVRGWKLEMVASWISRHSTGIRGKLALHAKLHSDNDADAAAAVKAS